MVAEDTVFAVLYDKFMFWSILVGIFTFGWMFLAMLRYRDGVEPDTSQIDHIEVGSFPVDRHHTTLEVFFYVLPTVIVAWLVVLALASNTAVWVIPDEAEAHDMKIIGKQWFWEYEYLDGLTWEDDPSLTYIDVDWKGTTLLVNSTNSNAATVSVTTVGGMTFSETTVFDPIAIDQMTGQAMAAMTFAPEKHAIVEVTDADGEVLHTWMHIPGEDETGYRDNFGFSSALGDDMILPCDEAVVFEMHSQPSDDSNPNYIGVQHSFWLPEWGVKEDLVPGIEGGTYMTITADDPGTFPIRCAEYCGNQHSMMIGQVKIVAAEGTDCSVDTGVKKSGESPPAGGAY
ncbi:MAG: hypothetical protein CMO41_06185 [Verrucomicrobiales bacterium]|nr:hypothetical protein [Verrucomicrobiales bacterium]